MASYIEINDLGSFANINALWAAHPEGGHEGDYCTIGGVKYHWDKYDRMWVANPNYGPTPAREVSTFDGDVNILNNLTVAGTIRAKGINNPGVGYFSTLAALEAKYPYPEVGWWAIVDDTIPGKIYHCVTEGEWTYSGQTGGAGEIELTDYVHKLDLYDLTNYGSEALESGYFYYTGGGVGQTMAENPSVDDNNRFGCGRIEVQEGDKLVVSSAGGETFCAWALTGTDRVILSVAAPNTDTTESPVELTAEQDGYLYYNCLLTHIESFFVKRYRSLIEGQLANVENQIASVEGRFSSMMGDTVYDDSALVDKWVWRNALSAVHTRKYRERATNHACMHLDVKCGDTVTVRTRAYTMGHSSQPEGKTAYETVGWAVTDTEKNILSAANPTDSVTTTTLHIEQDGAVYMNCANDSASLSIFSVTHTYGQTHRQVEKLEALTDVLKGDTDHLIAMYYGRSSREKWTPSTLKDVLTHTHTIGNRKGCTDWFFSSLLYIEFVTSERHKLCPNTAPGGDQDKPSTKEDWVWLMDRFFSNAEVEVRGKNEHEGLRGLDDAIEALKETMGNPPRRHKVVLTMPIPYYYSADSSKNHWGALSRSDIPDFNDEWMDIFDIHQTLNFDTGQSAAANYRTLANNDHREIVMKWYIDKAIARFNAENYENIDLAGFYWLDETLEYGSGQDPIVADIVEYIQGKGLKVYWIPMATGMGRFDADTTHIDETYLQTGYFWKDGNDNRELMTKGAMEYLYKEAVTQGCGLEFEMSSYLFPDFTSSLRFSSMTQAQLDGIGASLTDIDSDFMDRLETLTGVFEDEHYFWRRHIAYYLDNNMVLAMSMSPNERVRRFMDRLTEIINDKDIPASAVSTALDGKQDTLISGTNIKTINHQSLLGSGNITIQGGGGGGGITVDDVITEDSTNPVTSAAIYSSLQGVETKLPLVVNFTESNNVVTCDTSIADIYAAYSAGREVFGRFSAEGQLNLTLCLPNLVTFSNAFGNSIAQVMGIVENNTDTWTNNPITLQEQLTFDSTPTLGSSRPVTSEGIKVALNAKQDTLTFDNTPTANSTNPVTSGGIKTAIDAVKQLRIDLTATVSNGTTTYTADYTYAQILAAYNAGADLVVTIGGVGYPIYHLTNYENGWFYFNGICYDEIVCVKSVYLRPNGVWTVANDQFYSYELTYDSEPTANSNNPVRSGGIKTALDGKQEQLVSGTNIKTINSSSILGSGNIDLLTNTFCPIIEDTRSSAVAAITGVAPFSTLVDGQRIVLKLSYNMGLNSTLKLTLNGGSETNAFPIYFCYNNAVFAVQNATAAAGSYLELFFDLSNSRWLLSGKDTNTTYLAANQNDVNVGSQTDQRVFSPKLIHDNAYIVETTYSSGSLKANKFYDFGTVSSALTIPSLDATNNLVSNALNFYALRFIAGADNISITFPTGVLVDDTPTINTGDYVEIMINLYVENNTNHFYASIKVWQAQSQNS